MKVEICEDMSCAMFNATGQIITEVCVQILEPKIQKQIPSQKTGLCVVEEEIRHTGEKFYVLEYGHKFSEECQ